MGTFKGGYTGRMLRVDLSAQKITIEETPDVRKWLGPRGWNALIGWNEVGPGVDPYDAENRIIFSAGPLVGTPAPTSGRVAVSTSDAPRLPHAHVVDGNHGRLLGRGAQIRGL